MTTEVADGFACRQRGALARLRLPRSRVPRESLLSAMDVLAPLTLISAPKGSGRTTLLADWALRRMERGETVLWVSARRELNSVAALRSQLAALVWGPDHGGLSEVSGVPVHVRESVHTAADPLSAVCEADPERPVHLLIDDSEFLSSAPLRSWVTQRWTRCPNLFLATATTALYWIERPDPELSRTLLTGRQLMVEADQVQDFARSWGHRITPERARELHALTGGWLQLLHVVLEDGGVSPGATSARMRGFLDALRTDPGCATLLNAASIVAELGSVSESAFEHITTALTDARAGNATWVLPTTYCLIETGVVGVRAEQPLPAAAGEGHEGDDVGPHRSTTRNLVLPGALRDALAQRLATTRPEFVKPLHALAARHLSIDARPQDLQRIGLHARRAEDWVTLSALAAREGWYLVLRYPTEAQEAFGAIPEPVQQRYPVLATMSELLSGAALDTQADDVGVFGGSSGFEEAESGMLQRALGAADPRERTFLTTAAISALRRSGRTEAALRASEELGASIFHHRSGVGPLGRAMHCLQAGLAELGVGELERAVRRFRRVLEEATSPQTHCLAVAAAAHIAFVGAFELRRASAEEWLDRSEALIAEQPWTERLVQSVLALSRASLALDGFDRQTAQSIHRTMGPFAGAEVWAFDLHTRARLALVFGHPVSVLEEFTHVVALRTGGEGAEALGPFAAAVLTRARCDLLLSLAELNRAHALMTDALGHDPAKLRDTADSFLSRCLSAPYARLSRMRGRPQEARWVAASALAGSPTRRQAIELHLIDAAAALDMGEHEDAARSAVQGLSLVERDGVRTALLQLDLGSRLTLLDLAGQDPRMEVPDLQPALLTQPGIYPDSGDFVELTAREKAVLHELAAGNSVADIARLHVLSVNTVKKQTVSLYRKLGADGRTEALRRAFKLGLLS